MDTFPATTTACWHIYIQRRCRNYPEGVLPNCLWLPLQYSCLENPMDGEAWLATVHRVTKSQTQPKQLRSYARTTLDRMGFTLNIFVVFQIFSVRKYLCINCVINNLKIYNKALYWNYGIVVQIEKMSLIVSSQK